MKNGLEAVEALSGSRIDVDTGGRTMLREHGEDGTGDVIIRGFRWEGRGGGGQYRRNVVLTLPISGA